LTVVVDTSFLYAVFAENDKHHAAASAWYERSDEVLVTTPVAVAEMDHLIRRSGPQPADRIVIANLATRALEVDWWDDAVRTCWKIVDTRPEIGIADASLVALAAHRRTTRIATFDERHFRSLQPLTGESGFTLLPADAD
jgi:predicted nucleic acid-binding protein